MLNMGDNYGDYSGKAMIAAINENDPLKLKHVLEFSIINNSFINYIDEPHGYSALMTACTNVTENCEIAGLLMESGINFSLPHKAGRTPLYRSAESNHFNIAQILLDAGINVNIADKVGWTALHVAASKGNHEIAFNLLLAAGANLNLTTDAGYTPLYIAIMKGHTRLAIDFLAAGADPDIADKLGFTCLHKAAESGNESILKKLLSAGSNPNSLSIETHGSLSSLHIACFLGHIEVVKLLIAFHADANLPASDGCSPLTIALKRGKQDVVQYLLQLTHGNQ